MPWIGTGDDAIYGRSPTLFCARSTKLRSLHAFLALSTADHDLQTSKRVKNGNISFAAQTLERSHLITQCICSGRASKDENKHSRRSRTRALKLFFRHNLWPENSPNFNTHVPLRGKSALALAISRRVCFATRRSVSHFNPRRFFCFESRD